MRITPPNRRSPTALTSIILTGRWRSRPQHQERTFWVGLSAAGSTSPVIDVESDHGVPKRINLVAPGRPTNFKPITEMRWQSSTDTGRVVEMDSSSKSPDHL